MMSLMGVKTMDRESVRHSPPPGKEGIAGGPNQRRELKVHARSGPDKVQSVQQRPTMSLAGFQDETFVPKHKRYRLLTLGARECDGGGPYSWRP